MASRSSQPRKGDGLRVTRKRAATLSLLTGDRLAALLASHGGLYSESLGIDLASPCREETFRWLLASLLFGARIAESVAVRTFRAFQAHGLVTPDGIARADFAELLEIMGEGGYARYDGITSRKVQEAARKVAQEYAGDLSQLHDRAKDPADLMGRLMEFRGVGSVTAGIFLRELRGLWAKADPPLGALALLAAAHLGLRDVRRFWERHAVPGYDFRHFEVALTRVGKDFCRRGRCERAPFPHQGRQVPAAVNHS